MSSAHAANPCSRRAPATPRTFRTRDDTEVALRHLAGSDVGCPPQLGYEHPRSDQGGEPGSSLAGAKSQRAFHRCNSDARLEQAERTTKVGLARSERKRSAAASTLCSPSACRSRRPCRRRSSCFPESRPSSSHVLSRDTFLTTCRGLSGESCRSRSRCFSMSPSPPLAPSRRMVHVPPRSRLSGHSRAHRHMPGALGMTADDMFRSST